MNDTTDIIWKDIKDYKGLYQVNQFGEVKSLTRVVKLNTGHGKIKGKTLKLYTDANGYLYCTLCQNGKQKKKKVHRVVAEAFIDNPDSLPCVNHMDENKQNNFYKNLEWCDIKYNNSYGKRLDNVRKNNSKSIPIDFYKNDIFVKSFDSVNQAYKELKIDQRVIMKSLKGEKIKNKTIKFVKRK